MWSIAGLALLMAYGMVVWLKTNAIAEYLTLFRLDTLLFVDQFNKLKKDGFDGTFVDFLHEYYYDYFLVRLITCPICISVWLGALGWVAYPIGGIGMLVGPLALLFYLIYVKLM